MLLAAGLAVIPAVFAGASAASSAESASAPRSVSTQDPVSLGSSHVLDQAGVLSRGETKRIENAAKKLHTDHKLDLYVVFVDRFTDPGDAEDWANETASESGLGPTDYLLAIAANGHAYALSGDDIGPVDDDRLDRIEQNDIEPRLHGSDWAGAAIAAAQGLGDAGGGGGGGPALLVVSLLGAILIGGAALFVVRRRRKKKAAGGAEPGQPPPWPRRRTRRDGDPLLGPELTQKENG
ncbi:teichoic acid synthase [Leifsonia xyli subsp. cynodontis DSM 46306]|jgi:hypothetical protein|uniref:TPM domain-containing protein n=1 Tax=Leifsonia xyli subsp. cynodontis DSM 46306 TaxID=1389489 RepID=U3PEM3_LEIXC|nr:TPM domain-containing protein [Leifsonia xyli]AGW42053.1 teichoic acid synthase [Leifsonia xyli subsp. cynodontis DSM 46306]